MKRPCWSLHDHLWSRLEWAYLGLRIDIDVMDIIEVALGLRRSLEDEFLHPALLDDSMQARLITRKKRTWRIIEQEKGMRV